MHPAFNSGMSDLEDSPRAKGARQVYTASHIRSAPTRPAQPLNQGYPTDFDMGDSLEILEPLPGSQVSTYASVSETEYKVRKGDSLWVIARTFGVPLNDLLAANNLRKNAVLRVGQELTIPAPTGTSSAAPKAETTVEAATGAMMTYMVERGDTLSGIAAKTGTPVSQIKQANNLRSDVIYVGQKLKVSGSSGAKVAQKSTSQAKQPTITVGDTYKVRSGDSLSEISKRTQVSVARLVELNGINDPRRLQVGQVLQLKEKANVAAKTTTKPAAATQPRKTASQDLFDDDDFLFDDDDDLFGQGEEIPLISVKS